jgi:CRP-like cAMP-binding protein
MPEAILIQEGLVYAQRPDGQILWYEAEGESFTELDSFYRQAPSQTIIKVAEANTHLIYIHYKDLEALYAHSHRWALWGLRFQQRELLRIAHYYESLRYKDATQRYRELVEARPDILQRIEPPLFLTNVKGITTAQPDLCTDDLKRHTYECTRQNYQSPEGFAGATRGRDFNV